MHSIQGARVLVTGGAGFIGSTTVDQLLDAGAAEVRVIDNFVRGSVRNLDSALSTGRMVLIAGDLCDEEAIDRAVSGMDYIVHLAALRITHCAEARREAIDVLVRGTTNVLESAIRHNVRRIVAASSASVYGSPSYLPMDEDHPFNNRTLYGAAKIANEQMLRAYYDMCGLPYVAFRYFNVYGPRMDIDGVYTEVLIRWIDAINAGQRPKIFGDGSQSMDLVFVDDVARANVVGLMSEVSDEVFNVGLGVQISLNDLCSTLLRLTGSQLEPEYHKPRKINNVQTRRAAIEKAQRLLGFKAGVDLETGLNKLLKWHKAAKSDVPALAGRAL